MNEVNLTNCYICKLEMRDEKRHSHPSFYKSKEYVFCETCGLFFYFKENYFRWHSNWSINQYDWKFYYLQQIMPLTFSKEILDKYLNMKCFT